MFLVKFSIFWPHPNLKTAITWLYGKMAFLIFKNIIKLSLIYLKNDPKFQKSWEHKDLKNDLEHGKLEVEKLTVQLCLDLDPNYLTRVDHHRK